MKNAFAYFLLTFGVFVSVPHCGWAQANLPAAGANPIRPATPPPTVDQIVERAALASGGKPAWARITSMYLKGSVEIPSAHLTGSFESYSLAPNRTYQSITLGGAAAMKQGFDGTTAWKANPDHSFEDIQGDDLEDTKIDSDFYSEINLKELYPRMVLQQDSTIEGRPAYTVLATPLRGRTRKLYFDKETGLRAGMSAETTDNGKSIQVETYFDDFKSVEGIQVPYTLHVVTQNLTMVFHVQNIRTNIPILNWTFSKPATKANSAGPASSGFSGTEAQTGTEGVAGNTYTDSSFGFTYTFPARWTAHGGATNKEIMRVGKEMVAGDDPTRKAAYDAAMSRTSQLLTVFQYPVGTPGKYNPSIQVISERVDFAPGIRTGKDYLMNLEITMKKGTLPVDFAGNFTELTAGGKQFFRLNSELHFPTATVHQVIFSTKLDNSVLSFIFTSRTQEDLDMLCRTLDSLRFGSAPH
jgi:hypothetical protein